MEDAEAILRKEYITALREWVQLDSEYKALLPELGDLARVRPVALTLERVTELAAAQDKVDAAYRRYREALAHYQKYMRKKGRKG